MAINLNAVLVRLERATRENDPTWLLIIGYLLIADDHGSEGFVMGCMAMHHHTNLTLREGDIPGVDSEIVAGNWAAAAQIANGDDVDDADSIGIVGMALRLWGGALGRVAADRLAGDAPPEGTDFATSFLESLHIHVGPSWVDGTVSAAHAGSRGSEPSAAECARISKEGTGWRITVTSQTRFWGGGGADKPMSIVCSSTAAVVQLLLERLYARMDGDGVVRD